MAFLRFAFGAAAAAAMVPFHDARASGRFKPPTVTLCMNRSQRDAAANAASLVKESDFSIISGLSSEFNTPIIPLNTGPAPICMQLDQYLKAFWSWMPPTFETNTGSTDCLPAFVDIPIISHPNPFSPSFSRQKMVNGRITPPFPSVEVLSGLSFDGYRAHGFSTNGSPWWRETRGELLDYGRLLRYTILRGVETQIGGAEWENFYWAICEGSFKAIVGMGCNKCGRDAHGDVLTDSFQLLKEEELRMYASTWGKNGSGSQWLEEWSEHNYTSGTTLIESLEWGRLGPSHDVTADDPNCWVERFSKVSRGRRGELVSSQRFSGCSV